MGRGSRKEKKKVKVCLDINRPSHGRTLMHILFNAAMRWELVPYQYNPMSLVRVKDSSKTLREPRFLTVQEFRALLEHIPEPFRASHEWMPLDRSLADKLRQRTGDPLCAMRSVRSTVRSMERTNAEWHRRLRGREDQSMNTHIYTPRLKNTGERLRLKLNGADWRNHPRNRPSAVTPRPRSTAPVVISVKQDRSTRQIHLLKKKTRKCKLHMKSLPNRSSSNLNPESHPGANHGVRNRQRTL